MKVWVAFITLLVVASSDTGTQDNSHDNEHLVQQQPLEQVIEVGKMSSGSINPQISKQSLHYLKVGQIENKFLFIRISAPNPSTVSIGFYSNATRNLIKGCMENSFDSCYIPANLLKPNQTYAILVLSEVKIDRYMVYTYWGEIEHLKANDEIKFTFMQKNPTQLFHLEVEKSKNFQQLRIILKPETERRPDDFLKIFVNYKSMEEPTQQKYDKKSVHVWGDSEAIFLTREQIQLKQNENLLVYVYIAGSSSTIYTLTTELIQQAHHDLAIDETIYEYIQAKKQTFYHITFPNNSTNDKFVVKASVFIGQIEVGFYEDKELTKPYMQAPYQYMSDLQFFFEADRLKGQGNLYMRVGCKDSSATYQVTVQGRNSGKAFQITENVYEFLPVAKRQAVYFYHHIMNEASQMTAATYRKKFVFDMSMIEVTGVAKLYFYVCKPGSSEEQCKQYDNAMFNSVVQEVKPQSQTVGTKVIHTIEVERKMLRQINSVEQRVMIICVIHAQGVEKEALVALEYSNLNKIRLLRDDRAFEDRVRIQQTKYYKYINNDPQIYAIRIHYNEISGLSNIKVQRNDFRSKNDTSSVISPISGTNNTFMISKNVSQPIYISVTGVVKSVYTLSVTAVHTDHPITNAVTLAEDLQYEMKILPYQFINVEIHPVEASVVFSYSSQGGAVFVCQLDSRGICKKNSNNEPDTQYEMNGEIAINSGSVRSVKIRIANYAPYTQVTPSPSANGKGEIIANSALISTVKVKMIYHQPNNRHCQQKKINRVYNEVVKSGQCFKFQLPLMSAVEIFSSRIDNGPSFSLYFVCSAKVDPGYSHERLIIDGNTLQKHCYDEPENAQIMMMVADISSSAKNNIRVGFSVEYVNDTITLADGIGYHAAGRSIEGPLRTFFFEILDQKKNTEVMLINKKGIQKFYVDIVADTNKYNAVTEARAILSSQNSDFYSNPSVIVQQSDLSPHCKGNCVIVISVYSTQRAGTQIEYTLEVTQNELELSEDEVRNDYLTKNSMKYYKYEMRKSKSDLIFKVSDNGRSCAILYLGDRKYPSSKQNLVSSISGTLIYPNASSGVYFLAVEATDDCQYHLSVSEDLASLTKMEYGSQYDLSLKEGEGKWFYTYHAAEHSFKIVSLIKYGQLSIYANETTLERDVFQKIKQNQLDLSEFTFKTEYKNSLFVESGKDGFCRNCHYLFYVKAMKMTETTIYLGSEGSKISLQKDRQFFDQITNLTSITLATFADVGEGQLEAKIQSGAIKVYMSYQSQEQSYVFQSQKATSKKQYKFSKLADNHDPIFIKISATEVPAIYSLRLIPKIEVDPIINHLVNPGESTYVHLGQGNQKQCLSGYLKTKNEQIFFTQSLDEEVSLNELEINCKIKGGDTDKFQIQKIGNIYSLRFNYDSIFFTQVQSFEICLDSSKVQKSQSVDFMVFQASEVNLIQQDTEVPVKNSSKFVMYPQGSILIDVFQCKGTAQILYSDSEDKLSAAKTRDLDLLGIPGQNHAFKIQEPSTLYLQVNAPLATVSWTPFDPKTEKGVGYFKYSIGDLEYQPQFQKIQFKIGSVYPLSQDTKTQVKHIKYSLYFSNSKQKLQEAVMCELIQDEKLLKVNTTVKSASNKPHTYTSLILPKKVIQQTFDMNQTLYFNAVADMTLLPPVNQPQQSQQQHYRFVYFAQTVPANIFKQNKVEELSFNMLIALLAIVIVGVILLAYIFVKWVVPALGLLKNRMLVEEREQNQTDSMPVPPSSDRHQIGGDGNLETEDRMS